MLKMIKSCRKVLISLLLIVVCGTMYCGTTFFQLKVYSDNNKAVVRTIEEDVLSIDYQKIINGYENVKIINKEKVTSFEGVKSFNLLEFYELDLIAMIDMTANKEVKVKYRCDFNIESKIVLLTASFMNEGCADDVIDTMYGAPFVDENGNFDCVFDCDGEYIFLSDLQNAGLIENCGWFKKMCKKMANVAKNVTTTVGKFIHDNADVIVPFAIGVVGGLTGGAALPVLLAGTIAGAVIDGTKTAVQSYQETGKVNWIETGISAGIGAAVGLVATYTGYNIGSSLRPQTSDTSNTSNSSTQDNDKNSMAERGSWGDSNTLTDHFERHGSDFNCANEIDYARKANEFYNNRFDYQIKVDGQGVVRVYDKSTNTFGSYNSDGTTKTFFKPTGGQSYFDNQPGV